MAQESGRPWLSIGCFNPSKRTGVPKLSRGLAGASQASVTALSMKRCSLLLHCGQANDPGPTCWARYRQCHGRVASVAQWPLVLSVEHTTPVCRAGASHRSLSPID